MKDSLAKLETYVGLCDAVVGWELPHDTLGMRPADLEQSLEQPELLAVDVNVAHLLLFPLLVAALVCTHTHHVKLSDELSILLQFFVRQFLNGGVGG